LFYGVCFWFKGSLGVSQEKQKLFEKLLVTRVYPFGEFRLNDEKYLDYYKSNSGKPFCKVRIEPKLKVVLENFSEFLL
jgi:peptide-methionine (S)-S-oxide reductase